MLKAYVYRGSRQFFFLCMVVGLVCIWQPVQVSAEAADESIKVYVDLEQLEFDVPPLLKNDTTLVPFRPLFEAMGMKVNWDPHNQLVSGTNESFLITLTIGDRRATVNDEQKMLLQPAEMIDGRTLVPLRFIGEATGAYVVWDPYNREVHAVTVAFMEEHQITHELLEEVMEEYFASKETEEAEKERDVDETVDKTDPDSAYSPANHEFIQSLSGMYAGFRADVGGYECGGICWDLYTFLPDAKVVIGLPENGGPETIDCTVDECHDYSFHNGELQLGNGKSLTVKQTADGRPVINDVRLTAVQPVAAGYALDNDYIYHGYEGLVGIHPVSTSWTHSITFHPDGTFTSEDVMIGSLFTNIDPTYGATGSATSGTYYIEGNTITMSYKDGTVAEVLFFLHDNDPADIQVGVKNFYVDEE